MSMNHQSEQELLGGVEGTPNVQKKMLTVCGGPVCVYEAGESDCAPIVLLHGAMYDESRFIWDALFPALSERYHVFAIDTPRHGGSRPWEGELDRARLLEILTETFSLLGLERFSIGPVEWLWRRLSYGGIRQRPPAIAVAGADGSKPEAACVSDVGPRH